jgi:membrane protein YdbS with pleckstrin-like domain
MSWQSRLFKSPDEILAEHLTHGERILLIDEPSNNAFLVASTHQILLMFGVGAVVMLMGANGSGAASVILGLMVIVALAVPLAWQRLQKAYVRYALTDFRVMRSYGVFKRNLTWIPWSKVTDVAIEQSFPGRVFKYATVRIESANEASGFKEMKDLCDPKGFHNYIAALVEAKQGKIKHSVLTEVDA